MTELLNPGDGPAQFEQRLRRIEAELAALSTSRRAPTTSIASGAISILDSDGNVIGNVGTSPESGRLGISTFDTTTGETVAHIGEVQLTNINPAGTEIDEGVIVQDQDGIDILLATRTRGLIFPAQQFEWRTPNEFTAITSASFVTVYESTVKRAPSTAVRFDAIVGADAATTGEVRVQISGVVDGAAVTCAAGAFTYPEFKLDTAGLGLDPGSAFTVNLQARRTGGAGNINVYRPGPMRSWDTKSLGADTDGIYP